MSTIQRITTDLDLRALASRILDLDRTRSILIATTPTPTTPPTIDTKTLTAGLSDDHELWVVTADRTRLLEQLLGTAAGVYGGAVRIYPAGEAPDAGYVWLPQDDTTAKDMARAVAAARWVHRTRLRASPRRHPLVIMRRYMLDDKKNDGTR